MTEPLDPGLAPTATWAEIFAGMHERSPWLDRLTPAERVVAMQVRSGLSNREIALTLGKSECTVKKQVASCLKKCGVSSRMRLIARLQ